MTNSTIQGKINPFLLSEQVKYILHQKGFGKVFNYQDYDHFKKKTRKAFNKAQAIADLFLQDSTDIQSDFNEYIF